MLHIDIPTSADIEPLAQTRDPASVSVYRPTSPVTTEAPGFRIEFKNLIRDAVKQLTEGGADKREVASVEELAEELLDDEAFWAYLSHSLAVLLTPPRSAPSACRISSLDRLSRFLTGTI